MRILVLGNQGYIGPVVTAYLHKQDVGTVYGLDTGFFAHCLTTEDITPEFGLHTQFFKDVRDVVEEDLENFDALVYLAAISNDPMGDEFEKPTEEINQIAARRIAKIASKLGTKHFVFASSCSVYGAADGKQNENSLLNPLTTYAQSKINTEKELQSLASQNFKITCLRFATACGWSPRLRFDLVLNDFVASAIATNHIQILSDGSPWRPLIHVEDMARAIEWAIQRDNDENFLAINVGSDEWNYQVSELAEAVAKEIPNITIHINPDAQPDKRSYQVDFSLFERLAPYHLPQVTLKKAIKGLSSGLSRLKFTDSSFRNSKILIRLNTLRDHQKHNRLDNHLRWNFLNGK